MHLWRVFPASCSPKTHFPLNTASLSSVLIAVSISLMSKSLFRKMTYF